MLRQTHSYKLLTLYNTARSLEEDRTFYPSVFPHGRQANADPLNIQHAGCFCYDSGTPLNNRTLDAASWSAACAYEAAGAVRRGASGLAYALSRPPGHHASREHFGGYCYFNNSAIAAKRLRREGRVAILDVDFHHGNGTQSIFYRDANVLTVSIHGDPRDCYPFFAGFPTERGAGAGDGFNINVCLPVKASGRKFMQALTRHVLPIIDHFDPAHLVVAAGFDVYQKDPIGDFSLGTDDIQKMGELIGRLHYPTAVVQEGGYYTPHLGRNARAFLLGVRAGRSKRRHVFRS